jgi:hypothetical protein
MPKYNKFMFFLQYQIKKCALLPVILLIISSKILAQNIDYYEDMTYSENIKTVQFYSEENYFSYPVTKLNTDEKLILEFDDLSKETRDLSFTYIHCTPDWQPSDLMPGEYIDGFPDDDLLDYEISFNTLKDYRHYRQEIPSDACRPKLSGNYILLVYQDYDRDKPVLSRRFRIVDAKADINAEMKRSTDVQQADCCMQFTVKVHLQSGENVGDLRNASLHILRNNDDRFALHNLEPDFVKGSLYEYNNPRKMSLAGGSEFRYVNLKDRRHPTDKVAQIRFTDPYYIFSLYSDRAVPHVYSYTEDINGKFVITSEETSYPSTEAEYVLADFTLLTKRELFEGELYLYGDFSDRRILPENKMEWNEETKAYQKRIMLKQGFYNYQYVVYNALRDEVSLAYTEGNFYKTENNYVIYFYYKNPGDVYHQLLGYRVVNSQKRL